MLLETSIRHYLIRQVKKRSQALIRVGQKVVRQVIAVFYYVPFFYILLDSKCSFFRRPAVVSLYYT